MTAQELLKIEINEAEYQLIKALEGWDQGALDVKPIPTMMNAREQVTHLTEVYIAAAEHAAGQTHEWGSYQPQDTAWGPLVTDMWDARTAAEKAILATTDESILSTGAAFLVNHDSYHIGQLCALRIAVDPEWDPYSIYPSD